MKIIAERAALAAALTKAAALVSPSATMPILSTLQLEASTTGLYIRASNLEVDLELEVTAEVVRVGICCPDAKLLSQLVSKLPDGAQVELDHKDWSLTVRSGRTRAGVPTLRPEDFPDLAFREDGVSMTLPAASLLTLRDTVLPAAETDNTRYYLCGINICRDDTVGGKLVAAATNGHQMAVRVLRDEAPEDWPNIIIPTAVVRDFKLLLEGAVEVHLRTNGRLIEMVVDGRRMRARLVDGVFPDYRRAIPAGYQRSFDLPRKEMMAAIARVRLAADDKHRKISLELQDGSIRLYAAGETGQTVEDEVSAPDIKKLDAKGEGLTIHFNVTLLEQGLDCFGEGVVTLSLADTANPILIMPQGHTKSAGAPALFVVMPLRV